MILIGPYNKLVTSYHSLWTKFSRQRIAKLPSEKTRNSSKKTFFYGIKEISLVIILVDGLYVWNLAKITCFSIEASAIFL